MKYDLPTVLQLPKFGHHIGTVYPLDNDASGEALAAYYLRNGVDHELAKQGAEVRIPERDRLQHTYIVGATGYGKSELLKSLIYSYATRDMAAVIVIDPAGDFAREIAHWPETRHSIVYVHPTWFRGMTPTINPLDGTDDNQFAAQQLLEAFQEVIAGGLGSNVSLQMRALLMPCLLTLLDRPGSTLLDLKRFMLSDNGDLVALGMRSPYPAVAEFFRHEFGNDRYKLTKGSISTKLQDILNSGHVLNLTCGPSTIDLEKEIERKKLIVFNLAKGKIGPAESQAFGRLMVAHVLGIVLRRASAEEVPYERRTPVHLFIDECQNFITPSISTIMHETRKFRLHATLAQQTVGQGMSVEMQKAITGSCNTQITGYQQRLHQQDAAKLLGVTVQNVARLRIGQFIMAIGNRPPIMFRGLTHLLGSKHRMQKPTWVRFKLRQLMKYYRPTNPVQEPQEPQEPPQDNPFDADLV